MKILVQIIGSAGWQNHRNIFFVLKDDDDLKENFIRN